MADGLTPRQEKFVINLVSGMTQIDAYKGAGYSVRGKRSSIDTMASILADKPEVRARYNELMAGVQSDAIAPVIERKERLTTFIREDIVSEKGVVSRASNIQATAELNKMEKIYTEGVIQDNRTVNIIVGSEKARELVEGLMTGERNQKKR